MKVPTTVRTIDRSNTGRRRVGLLITLLFAGMLFTFSHGRGACDTRVLLGTPGNYVDVTTYVQTDQYGTTRVVGYNGQSSFVIIIDIVGGTVHDPNNNLIGITQTSP